MGAYCLYVTLGATPKTGQKTSPPGRIDLIISEGLTAVTPPGSLHGLKQIRTAQLMFTNDPV